MSNERPANQQPEARLIQLLGQGMANSAFRLIDHVKLGDLPLEIDAVVTSLKPKWRPEDAQYSRLFHYFRQHNVMEIKTDRDRFKVDDVPKLLAYGWHYMSKMHLENVHEVTLTALVHHLTRRVKAALPKFGLKLIAPDIYRRDSDMLAYVIVYANLPDETLPDELRAFTNTIRRQQLFLSCLGKQEKMPIVETIFDLFESEVTNIMLDLEEEKWRRIFSHVGGEKAGRRIVSALGEEKVISLLGEKKIVSALGEKKVISALGEEKIFSALGDEKVVDALLKNQRLLNLLLAKLDGKQRRKLPVKKAPLARNGRRLNPA